jgi:hypothetical protein
LLTVKSVVLVAEPPGVVTLILSVVAVEGTVAAIWGRRVHHERGGHIGEGHPGRCEVRPADRPAEVRPRDFHRRPGWSEGGVNEVIVGAGAVTTVALVALVRCPATVYTWIGPVVAPDGTTAMTELALVVVGVTRLEVLKRTWVGAVVKVPLIVTVEPT